MLARTHRVLKLSPHKHTGKNLSHSETSHGLLLILLLLFGSFLVFATKEALAVSESGSVNVSGVVQPPPPQSAAVIQNPAGGQKFNSSPIQVSGTCPVDTFVQLFNNEIFVGSTQCDDGRFNLEIGLFIGNNRLVARVFDSLHQYGPDSQPIEVTYTSTVALPRGVPQLFITTESEYQGVLAGKNLSLKIYLSGGTPSYAILIKWGDGKEEMVARNEKGIFTVDHTYEYGGVYNLTLQVTDNLNQKASFRGVILVNGPLVPSKIGTGSTTETPPSVPPAIIISWPLYILALYCVIFFWVGEKYELYKLKKAHRLKAN